MRLKQRTMRSPLGRNFLYVVALFVIVAVIISIREAYLFPISMDLEGKRIRAETAGQTTTAALLNSLNSTDEIVRLTTIVDSIPQLSLPSLLKFGFELLTTNRSKTPVLHSMQPAVAESLFHHLNSTDEVIRVTTIVDSIPELSLPSQLKFGFELLTTDRSKTPVLPFMQPAVAESLYYKYIQTLQIKCPEKRRFGTAGDGGWDACVSRPFNISAPCLVYSIGMGGEWSFDHMITDSYKCLDMAFDPTLGKQDHKAKELLWFYNTGLGIANMVNNRNWKVRTFGTLLEENKHLNATIDILKIDIEYSEWESIEAILREGSLRNVKQLMVEFHTLELHDGKNSTARDYAYYWQVLRGLDKLGFKTWHYQDNPSGQYTSAHSKIKLPCCANVCFLNTALII